MACKEEVNGFMPEKCGVPGPSQCLVIKLSLNSTLCKFTDPFVMQVVSLIYINYFYWQKRTQRGILVNP